jgi:hypothetical protein
VFLAGTAVSYISTSVDALKDTVLTSHAWLSLVTSMLEVLSKAGVMFLTIKPQAKSTATNLQVKTHLVEACKTWASKDVVKTAMAMESSSKETAALTSIKKFIESKTSFLQESVLAFCKSVVASSSSKDDKLVQLSSWSASSATSDGLILKMAKLTVDPPKTLDTDFDSISEPKPAHIMQCIKDHMLCRPLMEQASLPGLQDGDDGNAALLQKMSSHAEGLEGVMVKFIPLFDETLKTANDLNAKYRLASCYPHPPSLKSRDCCIVCLSWHASTHVPKTSILQCTVYYNRNLSNLLIDVTFCLTPCLGKPTVCTCASHNILHAAACASCNIKLSSICQPVDCVAYFICCLP